MSLLVMSKLPYSWMKLQSSSSSDDWSWWSVKETKRLEFCVREAAGRADGRLVGGAVGAEAGVLSDRAGGDNGGDVARLNFGVVLGSVEAGGVGGVAAGDGVAMRADGRGPPWPR